MTFVIRLIELLVATAASRHTATNYAARLAAIAGKMADRTWAWPYRELCS